MNAHEHMTAALGAIRRERARLDRRIAAQVPAIRDIAEHGKSEKERRLARRWLALCD